MRKKLERKTLLMFAVIALSLILLQAGSVSSAGETIIYKGHTIRDDGSGTFEVAGKGGFNYSKFTHNAWDPVYLNMSNYVGTEIKATLSTDAYVGSLEIFNTTSGTWNITNVSIFYNGSLTTRGFTFNFLNAENRQFRILISNALKDDGTYSWFLNTSILDTMYVLEFDPIANGVNVFAQSKGGVATMQTPCCLGAGPITNVNDENYANNMQTGENNQNRITVVIQVSPPMAVNKSNIISPTTNYEPTDYNISGSGDNVTWALLKSVVGGPNSANVTDDFVNNQSYNYYKLDVTKWNGGVINDINGWAINEWLGYNTTNITPAAATNPPTVNVSIANSTSANSTASLASEQLFSNVNFSDADLHQEVNSTFKWFINVSNGTDKVSGNRTAELVPFIYRGAVGYWHLDENGGTSGYADGSGQGNTGTVNGTLINKSGIIGGGVEFSGGGDYISVGNPASLRVIKNITMVAWVYVNGTTPGQIINVENVNGYGMSLATGNTLRYNIPGIGSRTSAAAAPLNRWTFVAISLDNTTLKYTFYVNDVVETQTGASPEGLLPPFTAPLLIGDNVYGSNPFSGVIDEVAIYNRTLNASEIKQLYLRTWYDYSPQLFLLQPYKDNSTGLNTSDNEAPTSVANAINASGVWAGTYGVNLTSNGASYLNYSSSGNFYEREGTIEFWTKLNYDPATTGASPYYFGTGVSDDFSILQRVTTRTLSVFANDPGYFFHYKNNWLQNEWHHVAVTWNKYTSNVTLHVDGVMVNNSGTAFEIPAQKGFKIGSRDLSSGSNCNCTISEFRISRKALTAQEINLSFSKSRAFFQNEFMLNSSNFAAGDTLKLEYSPKDSTGTAGTARNSSNLNVHAPKTADEAEGDAAMELGINSSIPTATKYKEQQVYVRNLSNNQTLGKFDWVAAFGGQRWLLNYITTGESYVRAPNLTTAVYVLEIADKTSTQITDEVSRFINATKS